MSLICTFVLGCIVLPLPAHQDAPPAAPPAGPAAGRQAPADAGAASLSAEQLEQIVAPIALYPDSLLAQILMAATYPLEIVEAARWRAKNAKLAGDALEKALQEFAWDPSVKSLCGFADVLKRMNDNLDWTQDLGDAFLGQREAVMGAVQAMRRKAKEAGTLKSGKELSITEEPPDVIVIEAADPEVIYVPTYYPSAVYGSWGYPYWYYPPMYPPPPAGGAWFGFSVGIIWGAAIWGDCDWGHSDIDIDIEHHNNFVDRTESGDRRQQAKDRAQANRGGATDKGNWQHDPSHRKGVGYKDERVAQKYGGAAGEKRVTRDQARGYGDRAATRPAGDRAAPGGAGSSRPGGGTLPAAGAGDAPTQRPGGGTAPARPASGAESARPATTDRAQQRSTGTGSSSFTGSSGASLDRASSSRGASSRGSAGARGGGGGRR
jgi:hypothetical protein